jgi:hypothetical protein
MNISKKHKEELRKLKETGLQGHFVKEWSPFLKQEVNVFVSDNKNIAIIDAEKELKEKIRKAKEEYAKVYIELRENNYITPGSMYWQDYIAQYAPFDEKYIQILLKWLPVLNDKEIALSILGYSKNKFDGRVFAEIFDQDKERKYRWKICDLIYTTSPIGIDDWIEKTFLDPYHSKNRTTEMLALAIGKMFPYEKASEILRKGFNLLPMHSAKALGEIGQARELEFLKEHQHKFYKYTEKEISRAIKKIERRLKQNR